ncbi:MAG: redoxin family protein [bacterium]|nr:redoxin family protein [bacterium]
MRCHHTAILAHFLILALLAFPFAMATADTVNSSHDSWSGQVAHVYGTRVVDLDGNVHRIGTDAGVEPVVLLFMNAFCPVSSRYAPELNDLATFADAHGTSFYGVMSGPYLTVGEARNFVADHGFDFPVIFDPSGDLALRLNPVVTPEAFVINSGDDVIYRGRIDDRFEAVGVLRNQITSHDLKDAIAMVGADGDPLPHSTNSVGCVFEGWEAERLPESVTYSRDIAPLLAANCTECHRDGSIAPFPLDTYVDAKRRARMLAFVTREQIMPPWRAVEGFGAFRDERHLSDRQIALLAAWAEAGAPFGEGVEALPESV